MPVASDIRTVKRNHHQYSDREARPSNAAYFEKQVLIDSPNVIQGLPGLCVNGKKQKMIPGFSGKYPAKGRLPTGLRGAYPFSRKKKADSSLKGEKARGEKAPGSN
jgi:hypothetical protein